MKSISQSVVLLSLWPVVLLFPLISVPFKSCVARAGEQTAPSVAGKRGTFKREVSETVVQRLTSSNWMPAAGGISPDSRRAFCIAQANGRLIAIVDGQEGKPYEGIIKGTPTFSPNGKRFAYVAQESGKQFVVVDGIGGKCYDAIGDTMTFGPDGATLAYRARTGARQCVVLNEREGESYDGIGGKPVISPDGKRIAYLAVRNGKWFAVIDGQEGREYEAMGALPVFSPNSRHIAYVAVSPVQNRLVPVLDGKELGQYKEMGQFTFSPDGEKWAFFAKSDNQWVVVSDGRVVGQYDGVTDAPVFNPKSNIAAFVAMREDGPRQAMFAVIDGEEGDRSDRVCGLIFSPNGEHHAFLCMTGYTLSEQSTRFVSQKNGETVADLSTKETLPEQWFVAVDGRRGESCEAVEKGSLCFSPDGRRLAYVAKLQGNRFMVVIDGPDGRMEGRQYEGVIQNKVAFDSPTEFHYMVLKDKSLCLIAEELKESEQ